MGKEMNIGVMTLIAALGAPAIVSAQGGVNLSWDDCGAAGVEVKYFACDTNAGSSTLYVSAIAPVPMPQLNTVEVAIDIIQSQPTLSDWWQMQAGGCRTQSLTGVFDFTGGPFSCRDIWGGTAAGGISYTPSYNGPNRPRIRGVAAVPGSVSADNSTEMYVFAFRMSHQRSAGEGACAGCTDKACFVLGYVRLTQPFGIGDEVIAHGLSRQWTFWRCPGIYGSEGNCTFSCSVPVVKPSWGGIKSLYR